jgi:hypothetical protein
MDDFKTALDWDDAAAVEDYDECSGQSEKAGK